jgi:hypothetical protein
MTATPLPDPLLASDAARVADRLHYAFGELLGVDDFRDEQTYHRGRLARALFHLHGSGTVAGLRVVAEGRPATGPDPDFNEIELRVQPGLAIDRAGRLIELPRPWCLRLRRWYRYLADNSAEVLRGAFRESAAGSLVGSVEVEVRLSFHACDRGYTPAFATGPFDALDASQPSRVRDAHRLRLVPFGTSQPAPATDPWTGLTTANWQEQVLNAWREPPRLPATLRNEDEALRRDTEITDLRLAILRVPVRLVSGTTAPEPDWQRTTWATPTAHLDNLARDFVLPCAALQRLAIA